MGKIYVNDLADVLVSKTGINKQLAQEFLTKFAETIQEGISDDKLVKIKGLGTFKVVDVEARESVNVNTGERVTIEGHQKLTFTPDASMKELVNRPFSQFETVVLNEGVDFNDAAVNQPEETTGDVLDEIEDSSAPLVEFVDESHDEKSVEQESPKPEPVAVADLPKEEETATEDISEENTESDASQETPQEESEEASEGIGASEETEGTGESEETEETEETVVIDDFEEGPGFKKYLKWIGLVLLALAVFLIGYLAGRGPKTTPQEPKTEIVENDTVKNLPNDSDTVDMQTEVEEESLEDEEEVADDDEETMEDEEEAKEEERPLDKWEAMDARVKTGAYRIIGTDTVVKAKAGDNLTRIGNRLLGPGMECYLEVYNGLSAGAVLSAGQEIKIPKVELKKKKRKIE